jgi:hypothetical protein
MKVITFSTKFPAKHPKKGEPTYFVEKVWKSFMDLEFGLPEEFHKYVDDYTKHLNSQKPIDLMATYFRVEPKHHTIRAGNRWKAGEWFSPRIWSGKPYASKQIEFAPPIQIKKIWNVEIETDFLNHVVVVIPTSKHSAYLLPADVVAKNDGLDVHDFINWFNVHPKKFRLFQGQILCWNESLNYSPIELLNAKECDATSAK